ncbi:MAG: PKD domain-containing protein [Balneolales bacterium]|nr:PKD domain-containing protein [Balneolales bacterium]
MMPYARGLRPTALLLLLLTGLCLLLPESAHAQQARGLFLAVFGEEAPPERGDPNHAQAIYIEIPDSETRPIYLRIFDAETGGYLDERHGRQFNSRTRFLLLGGDTAARTFGARADIQRSPYVHYAFPDEDIIHERTFGTDSRYDRRYYVLGDLPREKGHLTDDGYRRFVFLALGVEGNDGNFFDYVLSFDPNDKVEPDNARMYVYDLTLRMPADPNFQGQIRIPVRNNRQVQVGTFGLNNKPAEIKIPFHEPVELRSSPPGEWTFNNVNIPNPEYLESIGFNFFGTNYVNTFTFFVLDEQGNPLRIPLPIVDYEPVETPRFSFEQSYPAPESCNVIGLQSIIINGDDFFDPETMWIFEADTLIGASIERTFPEAGFHPFTMLISGMFEGERQTVALIDSVHVNQPPMAWAGGDRRFVAGNPIVFDGTVSEDPDGRITRYEWDFGDGNTGVGARVDHTYREPGVFTVTLTVTDDSGSPCATATSTATVRMNQAPVARIAAPASAQNGDTILLDGSASYDPDGEITEFLWEVNGQVVSHEPITEYTLTSNRNLNVKLTVTDDSFSGNASSTATHGVRVSRGPIANAGADKHISPNRPPTYNANRSRATDGRIVQYEWIFPGDVVREGMVVREPIAEPGEYWVYLRVTDSFGITDMDSLFVRVNYPPVPIITGDLIVNDGVVSLSAESSYDPDGEIISFEWNMGDGRRIVGPVANHTYRRPGRYTVQLTIVDDSGTFSSVQSRRVEVLVNQLPIARLEAPSEGSPNQTLRFDASASSDPDGEIIRYTWDFGDGNTAEGPVVTHRYANPGVYQVSLAVFDDTRLEESAGFAYTEITIHGPPRLIASYPERMSPGSRFEVDLSETQIPGSEASAWYWSTGGTDWVQGEVRESFIMPADGDKIIRFAVESTSGLPNARSEGSITIKPNHPPEIAALQDVITHEPTVSFDASSSSDPDGDLLRFRWDFGDGTTAEGPVVTHTFEGPGTYTVTLTADDQQELENSIVSQTVNVLINREPQIVMDFPEVICLNTPVQYAARAGTSQDVRFSWDFGNGITSDNASGNVRFTEIGRYVVTLEADDQLGLPNSQTRTTRTFQVAGAPIAAAGDDVVTCLTESVVFDGSASVSNAPDGTITRWKWDFGDGNTAEGQRVSHRYTQPGIYRATLQVECSLGVVCENSTSTATRTITIAAPARASFTIPEIVFAGDELVLDATPSVQEDQQIRRIRWEIGDNQEVVWELNQSRANQPVWEQRSGRRIVASINASDLQGRLPLTRITPDEGTHTIRLHIETTDETTCNSAISSRTVEVRPQPDVRIAGVPVLTPGQRHRFTLSGSNTDIDRIQEPVWVSNGEEFTGKEAFIGWNSPGTYTVQLFDRGITTISSQASALLDEVQVRVNAPPVPVISGPTLVTRGERATFTADESHDPDGTIVQYAWVTDNGQQGNSDSFSLEFDRPGNYTLTLSVTDNDGLANSRQSVTSTIQVIAPDMLDGSIPPIICLADPLDLPAQLGLDASRFESLFVSINGIPVREQSVSAIQFEEVGEQHMVITSADGTLLLDTRFEVYEPPIIEATVPRESSLSRADNTVMFDASRTAARYNGGVRLYWDFGDGNTAAGQRVRHMYQRPGTYTVTVTAVTLHDLPCNTSTKTFEITITQN